MNVTCSQGLVVTPLQCPQCGEPIWDLPRGHKLAKCWNTEGHADGGTLAFDTMSDDVTPDR